MSNCLAILRSLIGLNSENPPGNTRLIINWIQNWAKTNRIPFETQWYKKNQANIILTLGNAPKSIVMCGHLDTVPVGDLKNWEYDPLGAEEYQGYIYGRGSADMKGGVSACLGALKSLNESTDNLDNLDYKITFIGTSDEEVGLGGAKAVMKLGILDKADFLIVTEPTAMNVGIAEKGVLWFKIESFGKAAHGSTPEKGINAIEELTQLFPLLHKHLPKDIDPILGQSTLNIGKFKGGKSANVVPENAKVHCDYRLVPPIDPEIYANKISEIIQYYSKTSLASFTTEISQIMQPVSNSPENEFVRLFMEESENKNPIGLNYGTDAAVLVTQAPHPIPFVIYGPGDPKAIHCANERVPIAEVLEVESVITKFLKGVVTPSNGSD
ncbi:MAG: M20 family metallopeptidase [Candidatus Heimdallarchaeota archaeon]|nr:MAG: M20 family metallopeptidase [Candidatus Heimdallarchaeota archaeon]